MVLVVRAVSRQGLSRGCGRDRGRRLPVPPEARQTAPGESAHCFSGQRQPSRLMQTTPPSFPGPWCSPTAAATATATAATAATEIAYTPAAAFAITLLC